MNLIVTDKCTNSCPYCFAANEMSKTQQKNILEKKDIDTFMEFLNKDEGTISLNIIGGEPFIYKHIYYLLDLLFSCKQISNLTVFTGGVIKEEGIRNITKYRSKISLLYNLNEKKSYLNPRHHEIVINNIEKSIDSGIKTGIGYNIYKPDFNGKEIIKYCKEFGVKDLRFAIASPIYNEQSINIIPPENYIHLAGKVFAFLKMCYKDGIKAHLDCTLPICFFTDKKMGQVAKMHPQIIERIGKCGIPIDINYDLSVFRCFSFSSHFVKKITDFTTINDIRDYYKDNIDHTPDHPTIFNQCYYCKYKFRCNGGCLSNNPGFLSLQPRENRILELYKLIETGNFTEAKKILDNIAPISAADKLIEMHINYNMGNIRKAVIAARDGINMAKSKELTDTFVQFISSIKHKSQIKVRNNETG